MTTSALGESQKWCGAILGEYDAWMSDLWTWYLAKKSWIRCEKWAGASSCCQLLIPKGLVSCTESHHEDYEEHLDSNTSNSLAFVVNIRDAHYRDSKQNTVNNTFTLLITCLAFFGLGDPGVFHCEHCVLASGSYPYTRDSSQVTVADPRGGGGGATGAP